MIAGCLGQEWVSSSRERQIKSASEGNGAETVYRKNFDDPSIRLNTSDSKEGVSMYIHVTPSYTK
jgi:hypothetical protein